MIQYLLKKWSKMTSSAVTPYPIMASRKPKKSLQQILSWAW